ncbi:MAG TPA: bifunctional [glutamine synthetase] adenylyltransferase/[glutamine synthetase]-adenylyl-L-tyrosine phosphorylase [Actinocrinis sp.]|nr:bifunctional [glutamine synthetase] adenylyltransferase/[glutamine synthetase]-adenylyl-L-tyrosine phosphorylase [Actinocrinis sp.]
MVVDRERESRLSLLARRGFVDPTAAGALLGSDPFGELGRDPVVLDALSRCADPDLALAALGRLLEASDDPQTLRATLASSKPLRDRLLGVLGVSAALGDFVVRHPESWHVLEEFEVEDLTPQPDRFRALMFEAVGAAARTASATATATSTVSSADAGPIPMDGEREREGDAPLATLTGLAAEDALRVAYRRALLAITARDVAASADLSVVAADLAELAGATLEAALAVARAEDPASAALCRLAVIGMGKCGARELNYVSDVDVVFVAEPVRPEGGESAAVDDAEALRAATRLASRMMRLCSDSTAEGSIWQVDAGLRPEGKSGPLVRTLASHAAYYQRWAKTWEFQALLKARPVAGDAALGAAYIAMIGPMVWSAAGREHFVDDVQAMRRRVIDHATDTLRRAPGSVAVDRELKLGPGGLRDVEFAVQLLQLVHGRRDETLRAQGTMEALGALAEGGYVGREDAAHLTEAYRFLRTLEHRIQLFRLERTHTMPDNPAALRRIGRSMGWAIDPAGELGKAWRSHAREVRRLHEKLFYRPLLVAVARLDESSAAAVPSGTGPSPRLSAQEARARLAALGYADPAGALANIEALATGVSRRAAIQRTLLPVMLGWFADAPDPDAGLLAFRRVSDALGSTPWYLRTLRDEGEAAWRLARILSCGGYVPDLLLRDPAAVSLLGQRDGLVLRDRAAIEAEMMAVVDRAPNAEQAVTAVRAIRRRELFRIVAADLLGLLDGEASPEAAGGGAGGSGAQAGEGAGTEVGGGARIRSRAEAAVSGGRGAQAGGSVEAPDVGGPGGAGSGGTQVGNRSGAGVGEGTGVDESSGAGRWGGGALVGGGVEAGVGEGQSVRGSSGAGGAGGARVSGLVGEAVEGARGDAEGGAAGGSSEGWLADRTGNEASTDPLDRLGRALTDVTAATIEAALAAVVAFRVAGKDGGPAGSVSSGDRASESRVSDDGTSDSAAGGGASGEGELNGGNSVRGASGSVPSGDIRSGVSAGGVVSGGRVSDSAMSAGGASDSVAVGERAEAGAQWRLPTRLAVIAMGRFGGGELGYGSDADVMFVHEPVEGADEQQATAVAFELANELRRLLQTPGTDPPLVIDADLRPEGRQGPLVRSLASYAEYYRRWSRVWESQALLRAAPIAGAKDVGARFVALIDPLRYPEKGLSDADVLEIRRIKARMEAERLPRGADRALHTKLGPGGLSDVEWVVQLLQLRHGAQVPALRVTGTRPGLVAATAAGLIGEDDRLLLDDAWYQTTRMRNGITLVRGRPGDQVPTGARDLAVIARYLDSWHRGGVPVTEHGAGAGAGAGVSGVGLVPGAGAAPWESGGVAPALGGLLDRHRADKEALLDAHRRRARRARGVFERLFYG